MRQAEHFLFPERVSYPFGEPRIFAVLFNLATPGFRPAFFTAFNRHKAQIGSYRQDQLDIQHGQCGYYHRYE